ncbi:MAG: sodium:calcium antiporter [Candidatus Gottesmanbacteria bacterium]|nr:sodium:calcium antiporter [Candidatus Gottesmanbacteria bacterium]
MELSVTLFVIGAILLLVSTQAFIKLAERISASLKLSPLIIGLTVVSIGTSLPELTVSSIAALRGDIGLAMGNLIGSNIVNVFLVLGTGILVGKLRVGTIKTQVGTIKTQRNIYIMSGITGLFLLMYAFGIVNIIAGSILLVIALIVTFDEYVWGVRGRTREDVKMYAKRKYNRFSVFDIGKLCVSLAGLVIGGILTVSSVEKLSVLLGFSTTILGLSITAIVTSFPELLTTIFSEKDHQEKITIGNLIGSNIYNLALIGGIVLLFSSWKPITSYEVLMLITATLAFTIIVVGNKGKVIPNYVGYVLITLFGAYIYFLR